MAAAAAAVPVSLQHAGRRLDLDALEAHIDAFSENHTENVRVRRLDEDALIEAVGTRWRAARSSGSRGRGRSSGRARFGGGVSLPCLSSARATR